MRLKNNDNILNKNAEKGVAVTIVTKRHYQQMIYDHLNDITTYKKLDKDIDKDTLKLLA